MKYFDAHCHIQFDAYDLDREEIIARMRDAGVHGMVVGVDYESSCKAVELAQAHEHLVAAVGLHPNYTHVQKFEYDAFLNLAQDGKVVAIGECGLDYYRPDEPDAAAQVQREVLDQHIRLAIEVDKPLMVHSRPRKGSMDAYEDTISMVEDAQRTHGGKVRGDMHFFVGDVPTAQKFVSLGFTLSYTAVLTFTHDYDEVVRSVPLESLITETDSPYVAPAPNRGKRNDPLGVRSVAAAIAEIRGEDPETVREQLVQNARRLFGL